MLQDMMTELSDNWMTLAVGAARDLTRVLTLLAVVAIPVAILMTHVSNQYRVAHLGYDIAATTKTHQKLLEENRKLRIEAAVQGRTERMSTMARAQFGLEPTRPNQIILVRTKDASRPSEHAALTVSR